MVGKRNEFRSETDQFGEVQLPAGAYWGASTARATERLSTSSMQPLPELVSALVTIKKVCVLANLDAQALEPRVAQAICQSADEVLGGQWRDQFIIDPFHAGGSPALVRNIDEVLANRAEEILGGTTGSYSKVHPSRHVALNQSASHIYISAMRLALLTVLKELSPNLLDLERLLRRKALELDKIDISGRVNAKEGHVVTLGPKLNGLASAIERCHRRLNEVVPYLSEFCLSSGASGSIGARILDRLNDSTGFKFKQSDEPLRFSSSLTDFVVTSGSLSELSSELLRLAADLRILAQAPTGARSEVSLNANLKDKESLLLLDAIQMASCQMIGADAAVTIAARCGQLDNNPLAPVVSFNILQAISIVKRALPLFTQRCVATLCAGTSEFKSAGDTQTRSEDKSRPVVAAVSRPLVAADTTGSDIGNR